MCRAALVQPSRMGHTLCVACSSVHLTWAIHQGVILWAWSPSCQVSPWRPRGRRTGALVTGAVLSEYLCSPRCIRVQPKFVTCGARIVQLHARHCQAFQCNQMQPRQVVGSVQQCAPQTIYPVPSNCLVSLFFFF
jgi:hypothetical protein